MAEANASLILRASARESGLTRYFTGKPCKHGHISERQVSNGVCVSCFAEICRRFRKKHPDRIRHRNRRYALNNPELILEARRRFYRKNRDRILAKNRALHLKNPHWKRKAIRRYNERNPDAKRVYKHKRRSRAAGNGGAHTAADIAAIFKAQRGKCGCCRIKTGKKYHVDHIVALAKGGSNNRRNLQILCETCNTKKSSRDPIDFMRLMGRLL